MGEHRIKFYPPDPESQPLKAADIKLNILSDDSSGSKDTVQPTPEIDEVNITKSSISEGNTDGSAWTVRETDADDVLAPGLDINADRIPQRIEPANCVIKRWIDEKVAGGSYDMWIVAFTLGSP
jgi:hypothetical protein